MKIVEEPLFKSYVFVHIEDTLRPEIRFVDGVLNFVYWNKKPAIIKDEEIVEIKKFLSEYDDVEVKTIDVRPADEVMVNSGVMMGAKGRVLRVMGNNMVEVRIESLGFILTAKFDKKAIAKV